MMDTMRVFLADRMPPKEHSTLYVGGIGNSKPYEVIHVERRVHVGGEKHMQHAGWDVYLVKKDIPKCQVRQGCNTSCAFYKLGVGCTYDG
jgi:hypothetical protein